MIVRQILATAALGVAYLGTPVAAAYSGLDASLVVFFGGTLLAAAIAFWPTRGARR